MRRERARERRKGERIGLDEWVIIRSGTVRRKSNTAIARRSNCWRAICLTRTARSILMTSFHVLKELRFISLFFPFIFYFIFTSQHVVATIISVGK